MHANSSKIRNINLKSHTPEQNCDYRILLSIVPTFYIENDADIFPTHYTWKEAEEGFKMAFMMNKLAMINSGEIILQK